jgi:hypothetical protein
MEHDMGNKLQWTNGFGERVTSELLATFYDLDGKQWFVVRYWRAQGPWMIEADDETVVQTSQD